MRESSLILFVRCFVFNRFAFLTSLFLFFTTVYSIQASFKNLVEFASKFEDLIVIFLILPVLFFMVIVTATFPTYRTYIDLYNIYKSSRTKATIKAEKILRSSKSAYCNKRGAKLFLKDYKQREDF